MKRTLLGFGCVVVLATALSPISYANDDDRGEQRRPSERRFTRVGTFANFRNAGLGTLTVSEIITSTPDGRTLIYTDAEAGAIGFIDITDPGTPLAGGTVALDPDPASAPAYSPTSATVLRNQ